MKIRQYHDTVKQRFLDRLKTGKSQRCPTCDQHAKVYSRPMNAGAAAGMILMYREAGTDYVHIPTTAWLAQQGGEMARLRYWGLIEEAKEKRPDGGRAGWWRLTTEGVAFIKGQSKVPHKTISYNSKFLGYDDSVMINIWDALGHKHDYQELMRGNNIRLVG